MRELKLRYFIDLASNIGARAREDARVLDQAQKVIQGAITGTNNRLTNWNTLNARATGSTRQLQEVLTGASNKFAALDRVMTRVGTNTSMERQLGYMRRLVDVTDRAIQRTTRLKELAGKGIAAAPEAAAAVAGGYYATKRVTAPFINDYSNLESATTDLKVAMMDKDHKISKHFDAIAAEAKRLGEKLPGGTKDFMLGARALIEQGVPESVIANGGLRASSYFGALMGQGQYESATTIAKVREAYGLKDEELPQMADLMQRGRYAFGIAPGDYLEVAKYAAPTYNTMRLTGIENAKKLMAVQGIAAQVGLENSSFGTNFSMMLQRTSQIDSRLDRKSKEAKEVKAMLSEHGIEMSFFNDQGQFAGVENMLKQLAKLRGLKDIEQMKVLNRMFGVEAGRPAQILANKGMEAYEESLKRMDAQADLDSRIELKMETFASKLEALGGTIENVRAQISSQFGEGSKPVMDGTASFISGPLQGFYERNPGLGTATLAGLGASSLYLGGHMGAGLLQRFAGGAAQAGASGGAASAAAAASSASRMAVASKVATKVLKFGGPLALLGGGIDAVGVLADEKADKPRELTRVGVTTGGALGGAAAGAALGSVVPVLGTAVGGIIGAVLGSLGGGAVAGSLFDAMWAKKDPAVREASMMTSAPQLQQAQLGRGFISGLQVPQMDFVTLTAPGMGATAPLATGKTTEVKVGEGRIALDVRVTDDRVVAVPSVVQQPQLFKISAGGTNPGGF